MSLAVSEGQIEWCWIEWNYGFTWKKDILPQLAKYAIKEIDLNRCTYIIRANGLFAIE